MDINTLNLEDAVEHNVKIMLMYLRRKWTGNKMDRLIVIGPPDKVAVPLKTTFSLMSKWVTTYKKHGISHD